LRVRLTKQTNKQFYYQATLPASVMLNKKLPARLMAYYAAGRDVNAFLREAFD